MDNNDNNLVATGFDKMYRDEESGIGYYIFPAGYHLYKASFEPTQLTLEPGKPYFFGVKNENEEYIKSYEKEYGIIYEFVMKRNYNLIALDDSETQKIIYDNAPQNIKDILKNNYGYNNGGIRNSQSGPDRILSKYLCDNETEGYAIHNMRTDNIGGIFHDELMICDSANIDYVKRVTSDRKVQNIIDEGKLKRIDNQLKENRKKQRRIYYDDNEEEFYGRNFDYDSDNDNDNDNNNKDSSRQKLFGGNKRKTNRRRHKNMKKRTVKKKNMKKKRNN